MTDMRLAFAGLTLAAALAAAPVASMAEDSYPSRTISIQVPFTAGGPTDVMGRVLAEMLEKQLGASVIVENLTGASGVTGTMKVAGAKPDGYSLLLATPGPMVTLPLTDHALPYKLWEAFDPVSLVWSQPVALVTRSDRYPDVAAFIAAAKKKPGVLTYGSAGINSFNHIAGAYFATLAGIELLHVPYQGLAAAMTDTLAGNIDSTFVTTATLVGASKDVHPLFVTTAERVASMPDVPTAAELGFPQYQLTNYAALLAPRGTPREVIEKVNSALARAFADPKNVARIESFSGEATLLPGVQLVDFITRQEGIARAALGL